MTTPWPNVRILCDVNIPRKLLANLSPHEPESTIDKGWRELTNGDLLSAAEGAGFEAFLTGDKNLSYQQHIPSRSIAVVILSTTVWPVIRDNLPAVHAALDIAKPGTFQTVHLGLPPLRRRPFTGPKLT